MHRLVTLTGPGGVGKTRLALHVAGRAEAPPDSGVHVVSLASVVGPEWVAPAMLRALGGAEPGQAAEAALAERIGARNLLLVLDGFERVLEAAPLLVDLLGKAPNVRFLVTSRSTLRLAAEREYVVPALALPDLQDAATAGVAERSDAVRLFVERVQTGRPGFRLTDDNAPDVVAICRRVDGLPLALELAAARMRRRSPAELLARLHRRLPLLSAGSLSLPQRQRTLRQTISWSFGLLTRREQTLLERLAVFVGGFTVAGAEAVGREDGAPEFDTVDGLDALVGHSLLQPRSEPDGGLRFAMLETIREFALERLEASAAYQTVRARHGDFYRTLAEAAGPELTEPGQRVWLDRLERERDDLDAALDWFCEHRPEVALEVATQLAPLWRLRGPFRTGWVWLRRALEQAPHARAEVRAEALQRAGELAFRLGEYDSATGCFQEAAAAWQGAGSVGGVAHALHLLGTLSHRREDYPRAERLYAEALALWRSIDDPWGVPISLHTLGTVADERGDQTRAERLYAEALALWRRTTDAMGVAVSLDALGGLARARGEHDRAESLHGEALALKRRLGDELAIALSLDHLGALARARGEFGRAESLHEEALALKRRLGERRLVEFSLYNLCLDAYLAGDRARATALGREAISLCLELGKTADAARRLEGLAGAAAARESAAPAAVLLGAAAAVRSTIGVPPRDAAAHERLLETVRAALPPPDFAAAWERGLRATPEQAVAALTDAGAAPLTAAPPPADARAAPRRADRRRCGRYRGGAGSVRVAGSPTRWSAAGPRVSTASPPLPPGALRRRRRRGPRTRGGRHRCGAARWGQHEARPSPAHPDPVTVCAIVAPACRRPLWRSSPTPRARPRHRCAAVFGAPSRVVWSGGGKDSPPPPWTGRGMNSAWARW